MKLFLISFVAFMFIGVPIASSAPTFIVNGTQLLGADNVEVGGNLYNVEFVDGSCINLFSGCDDSLSDFTFNFNNFALANSAAQALLDQVLIGIYDSDPFRTNGCEFFSECEILSPYDIAGPDDVAVFRVNNLPTVTEDIIDLTTYFPATDTTPQTGAVYARWTPAAVPAPSTTILFSTGLLGLVGYRWWSTKTAQA